MQNALEVTNVKMEVARYNFNDIIFKNSGGYQGGIKPGDFTFKGFRAVDFRFWVGWQGPKDSIFQSFLRTRR